MFVSIGYLLLTIQRWLNLYSRHKMYRQVIRQAYQGSSVFVQRATNRPPVRAKSLRDCALINQSGEFRETQLLTDEKILISAVQPQQTLTLSEWTSYYRPQGVFTPDPSGEEVTVLVEARRPVNIESFLRHELSVAPSTKVHVLSHGAAVAWKSGSPFGILLHCTFEEFITLAKAFVDGLLTMDEDLEVNSLLTVKTEGHSANLFEGADTGMFSALNATQSQTVVSTTEDGVGIDPAIQTGHQVQVTDNWSNESLASDSTVGRVDLLQLSENDGEDVMNEGGSGEGLSEMELEGSTDSLSQSWKLVRSSSVCKPPNVLIYSGKVDSVRKFESVKKVLEDCLDPDCYVIYHLKYDDVDKTPWIENTALLVLASSKVYRDANEAFLQYFHNGGKILGLGSGFEPALIERKQLRADNWISEMTYKSFSNVSLVLGCYSYNMKKPAIDGLKVSKLAEDKDNNVCIVKITESKKESSPGLAILSQVLFDKDASYLGVTPEIFSTLKKSNAERFEILRDLLTTLGLECNPLNPPVLSQAILLTKSQELKTSFLKSLESRLSGETLKSGPVSLQFTADGSVPAKPDLLPVLVDEAGSICARFNVKTYLEQLTTKVLGNTVLYVDVVPSTMPLLDGMMFSVPKEIGLIAIACQQTSGKGRGGNSWLSPVGCAMFTMHVQLPLESQLGRAMSYLQHITSLAVIYSVCKQPGYEELDLRLKWPNDIYYSGQMKLGGVLVKSTIMDGVVHATIGCGFNVSNSNPTICINDVIQANNRQFSTDLVPCSTEELIARTVSHIEELIDQFQQEGAERFKQQYYQKWLHSNKTVTLASEGDLVVTIVGLDEYGYLLVETASGERKSVQPDGNSFDMMTNLITFKTR